MDLTASRRPSLRWHSDWAAAAADGGGLYYSSMLMWCDVVGDDALTDLRRSTIITARVTNDQPACMLDVLRVMQTVLLVWLIDKWTIRQLAEPSAYIRFAATAIYTWQPPPDVNDSS